MGQREQGFKICFPKSQLRVYKATKKTIDNQSHKTISAILVKRMNERRD